MDLVGTGEEPDEGPTIWLRRLDPAEEQELRAALERSMPKLDLLRALDESLERLGPTQSRAPTQVAPEDNFDLAGAGEKPGDETVVKKGRPLNLTERQEVFRQGFAIGLGILFALEVFAPFVYVVSGGTWNDIKDWMQIVFPATLTLVSGAIGFYFGTSAAPTTRARQHDDHDT